MQEKIAMMSHILLAIAAIAAVTVLAFAGRVDPTSALLVITGASGISTWGAVTAQRIGNQWPDQSGPSPSLPTAPLPPTTPTVPK